MAPLAPGENGPTRSTEPAMKAGPAASVESADASPAKGLLEELLAAAPDHIRQEYLRALESATPKERAEIERRLAEERDGILESIRLGQPRDAKRKLDKIFAKSQLRFEITEARNSLGILTDAIGLDNIRASEAYKAFKPDDPKLSKAAQAKLAAMPPTEKEQARVAYAILRDPRLQSAAHNKLGDAEANDLILQLRRDYPEFAKQRGEAGTPLAKVEAAPFLKPEVSQAQALAAPNASFKRDGDTVEFPAKDGKTTVRMDASVSPPKISVQPAGENVALPVKAGDYAPVYAAEVWEKQSSDNLKTLEATQENLLAKRGPEIFGNVRNHPELLPKGVSVPNFDKNDPQASITSLKEKLQARKEELAGMDISEASPNDIPDVSGIDQAIAMLDSFANDLAENTKALDAGRKSQEELRLAKAAAMEEYANGIERAKENARENLEKLKLRGIGPLGTEPVKLLIELANTDADIRANLGQPEPIDLEQPISPEGLSTIGRMAHAIYPAELFNGDVIRMGEPAAKPDGTMGVIDDKFLSEQLVRANLMDPATREIYLARFEDRIRDGIKPKSRSDESGNAGRPSADQTPPPISSEPKSAE